VICDSLKRNYIIKPTVDFFYCKRFGDIALILKTKETALLKTEIKKQSRDFQGNRGISLMNWAERLLNQLLTGLKITTTHT